jgi:hypothetical protein
VLIELTTFVETFLHCGSDRVASAAAAIGVAFADRRAAKGTDQLAPLSFPRKLSFTEFESPQIAACFLPGVAEPEEMMLDELDSTSLDDGTSSLTPDKYATVDVRHLNRSFLKCLFACR